MKKVLCFLTVLALLALVGCKEEQAAAQKPVVKDTAKVVAPVATVKADTAKAVKPVVAKVDTSKKK
jgi:uncharacterized protein YcfL